MLRIYFVLLIIVGLFGCNSFDQPDPVASYVHIPSMSMKAKPGYGSVQQDFPLAFVYLDGTLMGAFSIPATIPLIKAGDSEITVFAGIIKNGIKETAEAYPLVDRYVKNIKLTPGKVDTIWPVFSYRDDVVPQIVEDFESSAHLFPTILNGYGIGFTANEAFEGFKSGIMLMDTIKPLNEVGSVDLTTLPHDGTKIYVEISYKNEVDLLIGLKGFSSIDAATQYIVGLRPSDTWKKVYLDLTDEVLASDFPNYKLLIEAGLPHDGKQFLKTEARVLIDNVKLMY